MRHRVAGKKLGRNGAHRRAVMRNIVSSLFEHERIVTTIEKAKHYRRQAEKLITLGKEKNLHNVRRAQAILQNKDMVRKLFDELGPRFKDRPGGYTRILKLPKRRLGDNASQAIWELVDNRVLEAQLEAHAAEEA
ncbi:MAG: 50S ribosomal protein L17 [Planctomycetota bacterium]